NNGNYKELAKNYTYRVMDANGNNQTRTITVNIVYDVQTASADAIYALSLHDALPISASGVLANDEDGADGFAAGGGVVGVKAGSSTATPVITRFNTSIVGRHGPLTLQADGSYTYKSDANDISANDTDVFVYTIKDADG